MLGFPKLAGVLVALGVAMGALDARAQDAPKLSKIDRVSIRPDPTVRRGVLPNGMRYMLMPNSSPKGGVSLRLAVDVGSYEEGESERGWAHFIEHMAFRSTRSFPDGAVDRVFAPWGVAFGRDQNASTTMFATTYQLDMPKPDQTQLKSGFAWLRDVADGIVFTDDGVSHERGVVLAEMESRNSPMLMAQEAIGVWQAGNQRSVNRQPIGLRATLDAATAADLRRFHQKWYRPTHAIVAVVGDMPVEDMEAMVKATFAGWTASGAVPARAALVQPPTDRGRDAFNVAGPTLPVALSACRIHAAASPGPDDIVRLTGTARTQVWQEVLNQRLTRRTLAGDASLLGARMMSNDARDLAATCLAVLPTGDSWAEALVATRGEMMRFAAEGPTEIEMEKAVETVRSRLRGAALSAGSRSSPELAGALVSKEIAGEVFTTAADALYAFNVAIEDVTVEDLKARFAADWSGGAPLVAMVGPNPVSREALLSAWTRGGSEVLEARVADRPAAVWAYGSFGKPGRVVERTTIDNPGFTRLRFANGVILNFKQSRLEPNKVDMRMEFGIGRGEISDADFATVQFGGGMLVAGGLGRHSFADLQTIFADEANWDFQFNAGARSFSMRSATFSSSLGSQLPLMTAFMTDPGFDPSLNARIPTAIDMVYRAYLTQPATALSTAIVEAVAPGSASAMPPKAVFSKVTSGDFGRLLKPVLTTEAVELTIVGDLDEARAISLVSTTFGALPARKAPVRPKVQSSFLRYPEAAPPVIRAEHDGPADKASAMILWPLYVMTPERRREEYALKLLASVFDTALRRRTREELGKTYAPDVSTVGIDFADQGVLQVSIDAAPREVESLISEARALAARLQAGEITAQMLADAREPVLASARARRETNSWWAGAMSGSARDPEVLAEALQFEPLLSAVTVEDLKTAAARWLAREPIVGVAYPRAVATGAAQ